MGQSFGGASSQGPMAPPTPPPEVGANTPNDTTPWYAKGYNAGGANDPMILQNALANLTDPSSAAGIFKQLASSFDALQQQQGGSAPIMSALDKGTTYTKFQQPEAPPPAPQTPPAQQQPVQPWQPGGSGSSGGGGGGGGGAPSGGNTNAAPTQPAQPPQPNFPPGWEDTFSKQSPETQAAIQARYGNMSPDEIMKDWETNVAPRYAPGTDPGAILGGTAPIIPAAGGNAPPPNLPAGWLDTYNNLPPDTQAAINARYGTMSPDQIMQDWETNVVPNYAPGTSAADILSGNTPATGGTNVSGHTTPGGAPSITGGPTPYTTAHPGSANSAPTGFAGMRGNDANYYSILGDAAKAGANSSYDAAWDMPVHQEQGHYEDTPVDPLTGKNRKWVPGKLRYAPGYGPGANMTSDMNTPVYWGVGKVPEMNAQGTNYTPQPLTPQQQTQVTQNAAPPIMPPKPKPTGGSQFAAQTGF